MAALKFKISGDTAALNKSLNESKNLLSGLASAAAKVGTAGIAAGVAASLAGVGVAFKGVEKAAEMETLRTAFIPLLGGAAEAKMRIKELSKFAAATPFELPEIAKASKVLETLTRGALSTGKGLRMVGDLASGTGVGFDEIAVTVGRLYDGLDSGRPVGEALARLQELGAISGDTRGKLEQLQKEGKKGREVWGVAEKALGKFSGSMELQSETWTGKLSTFKDQIGLALAAFGEPIIDAIKPFLDKSISMTSALTEKAVGFGKTVGKAIALISAAFSSGQLPGLLKDGLMLAGKNFVNYLYGGIRGIIAGSWEWIKNIPELLLGAFKTLTNPDFWSGLGKIFKGLAEMMGLHFMNMLPSEVTKLLGVSQRDINAAMTNSRGTLVEGSEQARMAMAGYTGAVVDGAKKFGAAFVKEINSSNVMDTGAKEKSIAERIGKIRGIVAQAAMEKAEETLSAVPSSPAKDEDEGVEKVPNILGRLQPIISSLAAQGGAAGLLGIGKNMDQERNQLLKSIEANTRPKPGAATVAVYA